jgi:hypothetical protein
MSAMPTEAPAAPAPEAPAPPPPAAPVPAPPPAPVPQPPAQPREPDGRFTQPPAQPAPGDSIDWKKRAEDAAAEAERWKQQSRRQEQRSKLNHTELQQRDALLRLVAEKVGVEFDDRPDPEVLQQRLAEQTAVARQAAVELAVYRQSAQAQHVNAGALLDSREFMSRTSALDPDAPDFHAQLSDLVREAAGQPRYQFTQPPAPVQETVQPQVQAPVQPPAQPPAPASGADFSGAPRPGALWTQSDYDAYMATASRDDRDGRKLSAAIDAGLLTGLGIGRPKARGRR